MPSSNFYLRGIATALGKTTSTAVQSDNRYLSLIADAPDVASDNELLRRISGSSDRASSAEYLRRISGSPVVTSTERYFKLWLASSETPDEPDEPLELTNAEKLSLPVDTAVGTEVHVTDGCTVVTFFDKSGFYAPFDTVNGKRRFRWVDGPDSMTGFDWFFTYDGTKWTYCEDVDVQDLFDPGNEDTPWDALFNGTSPVPDLIVHPAVQQLAAPSTAQAAVFVSGGTQDGICPIYSEEGFGNGKEMFRLLGSTGIQDNGDFDGFSWESSSGTPQWVYFIGGTLTYYSLSDVATPDLAGTDKATVIVSGITGDAADVNTILKINGTSNGRPRYRDFFDNFGAQWSGTQWELYSANVGAVVATGTDAPTPDLATWTIVPNESWGGTPVVTNVAWLNASDDTPAPITVTSVSLGDLVAGNKLGSVVRAVNGSTNGRNKYSDVLAVATDITWDGTKWTDGTTNGSLNTAFPDIGTADPVASEANWSAV